MIDMITGYQYSLCVSGIIHWIPLLFIDYILICALYMWLGAIFKPKKVNLFNDIKRVKNGAKKDYAVYLGAPPQVYGVPRVDYVGNSSHLSRLLPGQAPIPISHWELRHG